MNSRWHRFLAAVVLILFVGARLQAQSGVGLEPISVVDAPGGEQDFPLVGSAAAAPIWYDAADHAGVVRVARDLQADIERVTGRRPDLLPGMLQGTPCAVIVGTLGRSVLIDTLVTNGKLQVADLRGKWETHVIATVEDPMPGVGRALVIAGSDKRGTIYGVYELCERLGVSPWYWWADVPPRKRAQAHVTPGRYCSGEPAVRYRGIFLNDEAPCLTGWAKEKFGGLNSQFYTKVFELLLRLRGNYLWPAMWDNAFNEDDPENPRLADEYGIVMGTSHHEPMMRAHKEWTSRRASIGNGKWNYATNAEALRVFFRQGIARNGSYENLVTVGMRGDGDEAMVSTGSLESDIRLLEGIIKDQRTILSEELGRPAETVPQLWALFTEVTKFYEAGMRVPEDVTLLWTDDNTGNLRRLPTQEERKRSGGAGIYYHIDMHGGPFAYQWINTNPLPKISEQMYLAHEYGADRIWIVNVGDLKPLELPLEFFLRMAWKPEEFIGAKVQEYTQRWAQREFGPEHAVQIAGLVSRYAKYNGWRKPELVTPETFSLTHYQEAERVLEAWKTLVAEAEKLYAELPAEQRDAYYQLVLHPAKASALVVEINIAAGRNRLYARQGRASANAEAEYVRALFRQDRELSEYYNTKLAGGKWNHLMDQPHLGQYTWEPPRVDMMPAVSELLPADREELGLAIEGDVSAWPDHYGEAVLPAFDSLNERNSYVEVFAQGLRPIDFSVRADKPWVVLTEDSGGRRDRRFLVSIDWDKAPEGSSNAMIIVTARNGQVLRARVPAVKATAAQVEAARGCFASLTGPVAIAATAARARTSVGAAHWVELPDYGRGDAALTVYPVTTPSVLPPQAAPALEYDVYLPRAGAQTVTLVLGPVMDFVPERGMRIAVSVDDAPPQVLDIFADRAAETFLSKNWWNVFTRDNARYLKSTHTLSAPGRHVLKLTMVDPGIVVQKIIISDEKLPETYFGPSLTPPRAATPAR